MHRGYLPSLYASFYPVRVLRFSNPKLSFCTKDDYNPYHTAHIRALAHPIY